MLHHSLNAPPSTSPLPYSVHSYLPSFFFFNDTATTEIYTLSLHDALPISGRRRASMQAMAQRPHHSTSMATRARSGWRSEEHTSELQSQSNLVCRLLLEKKKKKKKKRQ